MLRNRKKLIGILFILFSIVIAGCIGLYVYSTKWLESELTRLENDLKQQGYAVSYSKVTLFGNPFNLKITLLNPSVKDPRGLFEWKGEEIIVSMKPWNLYTLTFTFPGAQKLSVPQNTQISLGVLQFEGSTVQANLTSKGVLEGLTITIDRLISMLGETPQPVYLHDVSIEASNLSKPLSLHLSIKSEILGIEALLNKTPLDYAFLVELDATLSGYHKGDLPKTLAEWRDGGGVLDVNALKLTWPPIEIEADGTLTLDKDMYPLGSFSSRISGYRDALSYMVEIGWVKNKNASAASFALDLFSQPDEGGTKRLRIPITLQDKRLSIGPASVLNLSPIEGF